MVGKIGASCIVFIKVQCQRGLPVLTLLVTWRPDTYKIQFETDAFGRFVPCLGGRGETNGFRSPSLDQTQAEQIKTVPEP
jgi:hypothetical protein